MFVVLLESKSTVICSKEPELLGKFRQSSIHRINKKTEIEDLERFEKPPLLDVGWLLICSFNVTDVCLKRMATLSERNIYYFRVNSKQACATLLERLKEFKIEYRFINNYKTPKEEVVKYVLDNLDVSLTDAEFLVEYSGNYLPLVAKNVNSLSLVGSVDKSTIRKFAESNSAVPLYELSNYLLGNSKCSYSQIVSILENYKYAAKHVVDYLEKTFEGYVCVFKEISAGTLSMTNFKSFKRNTSIKTIKNYDDYQLQKIIESYGSISVEWLYYLYFTVKEMPRSRYSLYRILLLCKLI